MSVRIAFAHAAVTTDDEAGRISGWSPGELSASGRRQARELGQRWRGNQLAAVFCSDLARATETVEIAFANFRIPIHRDTRLRDCDYGALTGQPFRELVEHERHHPDDPFPGGQAYPQIIKQTRSFLRDLVAAWDDRCVLVVAHRINQLVLAHLIDGEDLTRLLDRHPAGPVPAPVPAPVAVWSYPPA